MMRRIRVFGAFAYDFVVGDDWLVAAVVVAGLAVTYGLSHGTRVHPWWLMPALLVVLLPVSLRRAVRKR